MKKLEPPPGSLSIAEAHRRGIQLPTTTLAEYDPEGWAVIEETLDRAGDLEEKLRRLLGPKFRSLKDSYSVTLFDQFARANLGHTAEEIIEGMHFLAAEALVDTYEAGLDNRIARELGQKRNQDAWVPDRKALWLSWINAYPGRGEIARFQERHNIDPSDRRKWHDDDPKFPDWSQTSKRIVSAIMSELK